MEYSKKQVESDSSSSQESEVIKELDTTSSTKKSYDCTFCKRGFTNAQALGGHMNLHRKDRAKAKQTTKPATIMRVSEDYMNPMYVAPISNDPSRYYPVIDSQSNYVMCYQPSASSPRNPPGHIDRDFMVPRSQSLGMNQEFLGAELSLGLGSTCVEDHNDQERRGTVEEAGLDLELCLGRNRNRWF